LAIARVLMQKPEVILADEPIASLDRALAGEIISLLVRIGSEGKRTLIVALHKVELAWEYFPRSTLESEIRSLRIDKNPFRTLLSEI
jgi:phosphonate transport system ATP-binding protein